MTISEHDVTEALARRGRRKGDEWVLPPGHAYTEDQAKKIVRACLLLGIEVTGTITSDAWLAIALRIADFESRLARLEIK